MAKVGEILKAARIEKGISIEDIALATHINKQYLVDLENDLPLRLPQTYIRAFIRSFALHVGLDPDEILCPTVADASVSPSPLQPVLPGVTLPPETPDRAQQPSGVRVKQHQFRTLFILSSIIILGLVALILFLQHQRQTVSVKEVSFPDMVKEQDQHAGAQVADSGVRTPGVSRAKTADSLTLEAVSVDTVWLSLLIDSTLTREYTLPPQHRMKWKAVQSFRVTAGSAGSVYFTLNGIHLGTLGQGNKPLKDILLTREILQKKEKPSPRTNANEKP
jgi:cytoskeletal protein RodZ